MVHPSNFQGMPRILYVGPHCPHGPTYGARLRTLHVARILSRIGRLGMVLLPYEAIDDATLERVRDEFDLRAVFFPEKKRSNSIRSLLSRELDPHSTDTQGATLGVEAATAMNAIVRDYDLIWFHGISAPNSLGFRGQHSSVLDIDDIPSQVHMGKAKSGTEAIFRMKSLHQSVLWRRREKVLLQRFGVVSVCSEKDKEYLGGDTRIQTIPNGFEAPTTETKRDRVSPPRLGFIGTLRYAPNVEGLRWFIRHVWPLIKAERKDARLRLVGLDTTEGISGEGVDIDGLGFVEDAAGEIATWSASIVPINVGGGTRIKIAESFSRKCPVVSTSLGAYGYHLESGVECLLADTPADLAAACLRLLNDADYGDTLAERAWERFHDEWSWDAIAPRVATAVETCLSHSGSAAGR